MTSQGIEYKVDTNNNFKTNSYLDGFLVLLFLPTLVLNVSSALMSPHRKKIRKKEVQDYLKADITFHKV